VVSSISLLTNIVPGKKLGSRRDFSKSRPQTNKLLAIVHVRLGKFTVTEELVLVTTPYDNQCTPTAFLITGILGFSPSFPPVPLYCIKCWAQAIIDEGCRESIILAVMKFNNPQMGFGCEKA